MVWALLISSGRLFQTRHPEHLTLCLKYSVLGLSGIKQPAEDDLRLIIVFTLFHRVKLSEIYAGATLLKILNINLAFLR